MQAYRLLTGPDDSSFCHRVSQALSNGWELHGSPMVTTGTDGKITCAQAVVKTRNGIAYEEGMKLSEL